MSKSRDQFKLVHLRIFAPTAQPSQCWHPVTGYWSKHIRWASGWFVSYWNAFLFLVCHVQKLLEARIMFFWRIYSRFSNRCLYRIMQLFNFSHDFLLMSILLQYCKLFYSKFIITNARGLCIPTTYYWVNLKFTRILSNLFVAVFNPNSLWGWKGFAISQMLKKLGGNGGRVLHFSQWKHHLIRWHDSCT